MVPHFAQGAAMGLEDAVVLSELLRVHDPDLAFQRFEMLRKPRTSQIQRMAHQNARLFHQDNRLTTAVRNTMMPLVSRFLPSLFTRRFDWVYSYDAALAAKRN